MRSARNLELHELIGLECEVVDSTNPLQIGIWGVVIDETKNTLVFETPRGRKMLQKKGAKFKFNVNGDTRIIIGDRIAYRPHERTKKLIWRRRKW